MPRKPPRGSLLNRPGPAAPAPPAPAGSASPPSPPARRRGGFALGPQYQFLAVYNPATSVYRQRFDEALRSSSTDALAMWRNGLIGEQLGRRWRAGRRLRWHVEPDDPRNWLQKAAAQRYTKVLESIPRLAQLRLAVQERMFYGKAAAQLEWGREWVDGKPCWTVTNHRPVNGDSVGFTHGGVPKIQVASQARFDPDVPRPTLVNDDRGRALVLDTPFWRDRFVIGQFEPHAPDWGSESEMALAMYGLGLRGRLYWTWWLHEEVQGWHLDALKRFGSNGQLYGFYEEGDDAAAEAMLAALKQISEDNVAVFPRPKGSADGEDVFTQIPAANIAYEVQAAFLDRMEGVVKRAVCGSEETTSGSVGASEFSQGAFEDVVMCDADEEGEILTRELLAPIVRHNEGRLPFKLRVVVQPKHQDVGEKLAAVRVLYDMGMPLDSEDVYGMAGIAPPRDGASVVRSPQAALPAPGGGPGPGGGDHAADTGRSPAKNLPAGLDASIPRALRSGGDDVAADDEAAGTVQHARDPWAMRARYEAAPEEPRADGLGRLREAVRTRPRR